MTSNSTPRAELVANSRGVFNVILKVRASWALGHSAAVAANRLFCLRSGAVVIRRVRASWALGHSAAVAANVRFRLRPDAVAGPHRRPTRAPNNRHPLGFVGRNRPSAGSACSRTFFSGPFGGPPKNVGSSGALGDRSTCRSDVFGGSGPGERFWKEHPMGPAASARRASF
jgi:hypothetical protein